MNETGQSFNQKIVFSDIPGQNIWNEVKKSSKTGQNYEIFYIFLRTFSLLLPKVQIPDVSLYLTFRFFQYFLIPKDPKS